MNVRLRERLPNFQGKDWLERLLLAYLVVAPTTAVCLGANGAAAILGSVGAAALLLTRLPDISSLSLFGLRAELKRSVEQVQVTIHQLQAMATAFAEATLSQLALSGQLRAYMYTTAKFELRNQIVRSLEEIGTNEADILRAQGDWIAIHARLLLDQIEARAGALGFGNAQQAMDGLARDEDKDAPPPAAVRAELDKRIPNDEALSELTAEYERLWTTGGMDNPSLIPSNAVMRPRREQQPGA